MAARVSSRRRRTRPRFHRGRRSLGSRSRAAIPATSSGPGTGRSTCARRTRTAVRRLFATLGAGRGPVAASVAGQAMTPIDRYRFRRRMSGGGQHAGHLDSRSKDVESRYPSSARRRTHHAEESPSRLNDVPRMADSGILARLARERNVSPRFRESTTPRVHCIHSAWSCPVGESESRLVHAAASRCRSATVSSMFTALAPLTHIRVQPVVLTPATRRSSAAPITSGSGTYTRYEGWSCQVAGGNGVRGGCSGRRFRCSPGVRAGRERVVGRRAVRLICAGWLPQDGLFGWSGPLV
jgi:hypothetical protein